MSDFLQRVATTVIQPKAKLQPMMGSIFAPATLYSPAEPFAAEISSQIVAPRPHEPTTAPHFDTSSQAFANRAFGTEERLFSSTSHENSSLSHSNRTPPSDRPLLPAFDNPQDLRGPAHPHPFVEDSAIELAKPAAIRSTAPGPYQLIAVSQPPSCRLQPRESFPNHAAARTAAFETARGLQPAQREADEIHIHIGRIEVAAIAQPAPRPTAAAARRSLNLDGYLRRGNGRPG